LLRGAAAEEMDMSSCHSQASAILGAVEVRSQHYGISPACPPVLAALICCAMGVGMRRIDFSTTVHVFNQAV